MRTIGFFAGHSAFELGSTSDMILFFNCLNAFVMHKQQGRDWSLLSDRLYRRYIPQQNADEALELMQRAQQVFATLPSASVNWENMPADSASTWLNPKQFTLADIFSKYFEHYANAHNAAQSFFEAFNIYRPIRTIVADISGLMAENRRALEDYDKLDGKPFWLQ
jgi:hypothetical protein